MRTAIVSDLHLGSALGEDLLRDPGIRRVLLEEIASADRLVLLGDVLELRELPLSEVLGVVQPFFEELGEAMAGRRVVLVPGNHDHRLAEPLLEEVALRRRPARARAPCPAPRPSRASRIAGWLGDAELGIAYPGIWLRDNVYATHGHYMDCHMSLPRLECLAAAAIMRLAGGPPRPPTPGDYERILRPIYGLSFGLAEAGLARGATRPPSAPGARSRAAAATAAAPAAQRSRRRSPPASRAASGCSTALLRADFEADFSPGAITRSGIAAATEMARRLQVDAAHMITGHTHRAGPEEGEAEWPLPGGGRLHNTGSWVYRRRLPPSRLAARPLLARDCHLGRGRRSAPPGAPAGRPPARGAARGGCAGAARASAYSHSAMTGRSPAPASSWRK